MLHRHQWLGHFSCVWYHRSQRPSPSPPNRIQTVLHCTREHLSIQPATVCEDRPSFIRSAQLLFWCTAGFCAGSAAIRRLRVTSGKRHREFPCVVPAICRWHAAVFVYESQRRSTPSPHTANMFDGWAWLVSVEQPTSEYRLVRRGRTWNCQSPPAGSHSRLHRGDWCYAASRTKAEVSWRYSRLYGDSHSTIVRLLYPRPATTTLERSSTFDICLSL